MISQKLLRALSAELVSNILEISYSSEATKDFIEDISGLIFDRAEEIFSTKLILGTSLYFNTSKTDFALCAKSKDGFSRGQEILQLLQGSGRVPDSRIIVELIKRSFPEKFLCVAVSDTAITKRVYGVIYLMLDSNITNDNYSELIQLAHALSSFISKYFSFYFRNYIGRIREKVYKDISLTKGYKEKVIFYRILDGLTKIVPFNHSGTFFLFMPREEKLLVYAEKNGEASPKHDSDKKEYYGGHYFDFPKERFETIKDGTQSIVLADSSLPWLSDILRYKSLPINNILLKKIHIPLDVTIPTPDSAICGLLILCNYTDRKFTLGDISVLDSFLNTNVKNQDDFNILAFLKRVRENFHEISGQLNLADVKKIDSKSLLRDLEERTEKYLKSVRPEAGEIAVFFVSGTEPSSKFIGIPPSTKGYLISRNFSKEIEGSFYQILSSTKNVILGEDLFGKKWKTLIAVRIPNSPNLQYLCVLRENFFEISHYDRLIIKFISEHIGLAMADFSNLEISAKIFEYIEAVGKLGTKDPSDKVEKYFEDLLNIAIKYTRSQKGNIYIVSGNREQLELKAQIGNGKKVETIGMKEKGVVPYVAREHTKFKNNPFVIDNISEFIRKRKDIGYIDSLEDMQAEMTVPMFLGEDLWGVLNVESNYPQNYRNPEKHILLNISQKASEIWQQQQLSYALEKTGEFLKTTTEQPISLFDEPDIYKICQPQINQLLDIVTQSTSAHSATVRFLDDMSESLILYNQSEQGKKSSKERIYYNENPNCVIYTAIKDREPIDISDVHNIDRNKYPGIEFFSTKEGTNAEYAIPLRYFNRIDGVLNIENGHSFTENEKFIYRTMARLIELLLIQQIYIVRRQTFDQITMIMTQLHSLDNAFRKISNYLKAYKNKPTGIDQLISSIGDICDNVSKIIEPLRSLKTEKEKIALKTLAQHIRSIPEGPNNELRIDLDKSIINSLVEVNLEQLKSVLANLLYNAYRKSESIKVAVTIKRKWNGNIQILIEDNGAGIKDAQMIKKIFKIPILKSSGQFSMGCFIGGIVLADMGGRAYIQKSDESGTIVGVDIPIYQN